MNELELKYGCNPNQRPSRIYMKNGSDLPVTVLSGTPGYINFLDALNSWQLVRELRGATGLPAAASFKHVSPAGAAVGLPLSDIDRRICFVDDEGELSPIACAYIRARGADRMSSYGDWAALSDPCDARTARYLKHEVSDGIIAPGYTDEALEILRAKKGGRYNVVQIDPDYRCAPVETKDVFGISFEQGHNFFKIDRALLANVVTANREIPEPAQRDMLVEPHNAQVHAVELRMLRQGWPGHRRGRWPAESRALHPPCRRQGRHLVSAAASQGAGPALRRGHPPSQP